MNNRNACIVLNMLSGIGYAKYKALVTEFGEPARIFEASKSELTAVKGISDTIADKILSYKELVDLDNELLLAERGGVQIITLADKEYPDELRNIYDPPLCLYVRGKLPSFTRNAVAIVGSRKMSMYGERMTKAFAQDAVNQGFIVVSGLAFGVDYVAHKAVVDADGITVAAFDIFSYLADQFSGKHVLCVYVAYSFTTFRNMTIVITQDKPGRNPSASCFVHEVVWAHITAQPVRVQPPPSR